MTVLLIAIYGLAVALLDIWAYRRFHNRWKRRERARVVVGVLVVMLPLLPFVVVGVFDALVWLTIFFGFGIAGAVTLFLDIQAETEQSEQRRGGFQDAQSRE